MSTPLDATQQSYARLIVQAGVNLQPGQSLAIRSELGQREFVRPLLKAAYAAGARYIHVQWSDPVSEQLRLLHSQPDFLDFMPTYEAQRLQQMLDEGWASLSLVGSEYPDIFANVNPALLRRQEAARNEKLAFWYLQAMNDQFPWCVAAVPTAAWAQKVLPQLSAAQAEAQLWQQVLACCRADQPDPIAAWQRHDAGLKSVIRFLTHQQVEALHFVDPSLGPNGKPRTNLTVSLTNRPRWEGGSAQTPAGTPFFPNLPTEELFSTPHRGRTNGWCTTTRPFYPLAQEVKDAYFEFQAGEVVSFRAAHGQSALEQFFQIPGARHLGEVALVDDRSPVNQTGLVFYNTLFDENAACHIAFGRAYPVGVAGGTTMTAADLRALGVNEADTHLDVMIGSAQMQVDGLTAAGHRVPIMAAGRFHPQVLAP